MLRTSSYTIYVDLPENPDEMLLVHGYTGAHDRVSRQVARYLLALEAGPPPPPLHGRWVTEPAAASGNGNGGASAPSAETVARLRRRGYLTPMSVEEEEGFFARIAKKVHRTELRRSPSYLLIPTYDCNLRCPYCFQDHMRTRDENAHLLRTMSPGMVDRILAALPAIEREQGVPEDRELSRRIGFFGGEPLLAANRPLVEYAMTRARELAKTSFWAVSNGTELDAYADLLGPDGIGYLQITLDGPPDEHDRRRVYVDGSGSFERIAHNLDLCLDRGVNVHVRMNIDRNNLPLVPFLAEEIVARGWDRRAGFCCYTAVIRAANEHTCAGSTFGTWEMDRAIDELRSAIPSMRVIGRPDDMIEVRARRIFDTRADAVPQLKSSFCAAHHSMYIFDPFGDVYACWERTGDPRIRMGRVTDEGGVELEDAAARMWHSRTVASNPTCRKCRYAMHCGGGCAVQAQSQPGGRFFTNHCDGFGDRFRYSIARAYQDFAAGVRVECAERECDR